LRTEAALTDEPSTQQPAAGLSSWTSRHTREFAATVLRPLGSDESDGAARTALDAVLADRSVRPERLTVYPPQIRVEKPPRRDEPPQRLVRVRVRDADRGVVHEITVADDGVIEHELNEHGAPPFTDDERAVGRRLLEGDSRFGDVLADPTVEIDWFNPGHGEQRLLGARVVRVDDTRVVDVIDSAVVDLDAGTVDEGGDLDG
jgi:hypothetical protein